MLQDAIPKMVPGKLGVSAPDVADFRRLSHSFEDLGAFQSVAMDLSGSGTPTSVAETRTSAAVFQILETAPAMGRTVTEGEDKIGNNAAGRSNSRWQARFRAAPDA